MALNGWIILLALLLSPATWASPPSAEAATQTVEVKADHVDREEHPYRKMLKAMEMFAPYQAQHPDAVLRFKLIPRRADVDMDGLRLAIVGDQGREAVELASDHSFTLPVRSDLREQNAMVRANLPSGDLGWMVQIRRAGMPPDRRVLGDLREECKLDLKAAELMRGIKPPAFLILAAVANPCEFKGVSWFGYSEKPLFAVRLRSGDRQTSLLSDRLYAGTTTKTLTVLYPLLDWPYLKDHFYQPPYQDTDWPDDTLLEIEPMEDATTTTEASQ